MERKVKKNTHWIRIILAAVIAISLWIFTHIKLDPVSEVAPHVVSWRSSMHQNSRLATGFHIRLGDKVYIMTNKHVCDAHLKFYKHNFIQFDNYVGEILKISKEHDLCLVTSDRKEGLEISLKEAKNFDRIYLVGHPRGMGKTIREGRIIERIKIRTPWLDKKVVDTQRISATAYRGNSGSPVVNEDGEVIGVLFAGSPAYPTEPFIVPYEYLVSFVMEYL